MRVEKFSVNGTLSLNCLSHSRGQVHLSFAVVTLASLLSLFRYHRWQVVLSIGTPTRLAGLSAESPKAKYEVVIYAT